MIRTRTPASGVNYTLTASNVGPAAPSGRWMDRNGQVLILAPVSLATLAIRKTRVDIVGSPQLKIEGALLYLDVEGLPGRDFYCLIGAQAMATPPG